MARDDPTIERVRAAGRAIAEKCGWDVHAFFEWARGIEAEHPDRVVGYETDRKPKTE